MNPYEVLQIEEGADKAQVKRAYFRLVREHTPEKDPEGFARIREAYERLSNPQKDVDSPELPIPKHPYAEMFAKQIERCMEEDDWNLAKETAEEGCRRFPGSIYFLYQAAVAQRICGNTGKAVKSARLLVENDPDNKWFWRELALSSFGRGYTKKAYPAFVKAYEMGCRDNDFILTFSLDCREYPDYEMGKRIMEPFTDPALRWTKEDIFIPLEAYTAAVWFRGALGESIEETGLKFVQFLEKYKRSLADQFDSCLGMLGSMLEMKLKPEIIDRGLKALEAVNDQTANKSDRQRNREFLDEFQAYRMKEDERVPRSLKYLNGMFVMLGEPDRFGATDCRLCMLEEWEQILEAEAYIKEQYPVFYGKAKPFLDRIRSQQDIEIFRHRLQDEYRKMLEYSYEGGRYLEWYPERRDSVFGKTVKSSQETYVRVGKKIGRNDPCPCGSGRKYKFCCGRK